MMEQLPTPTNFSLYVIRFGGNICFLYLVILRIIKDSVMGRVLNN